MVDWRIETRLFEISREYNQGAHTHTHSHTPREKNPRRENLLSARGAGRARLCPHSAHRQTTEQAPGPPRPAPPTTRTATHSPHVHTARDTQKTHRVTARARCCVCCEYIVSYQLGRLWLYTGTLGRSPEQLSTKEKPSARLALPLPLPGRNAGALASHATSTTHSAAATHTTSPFLWFCRSCSINWRRRRRRRRRRRWWRQALNLFGGGLHTPTRAQ